MALGRLLKSGMVGGLAGMAAKNAGVGIGDIARRGGFGLAGMALAKKKKRGEEGEGGSRPTTEPTMKKGGKVSSAATAVHKHERAMHKGKPLTKMAKGGSAAKRADGIAKKGRTKGKMV